MREGANSRTDGSRRPTRRPEARLFRAESMSREELRAYGRRLRGQTQRRTHAEWTPHAHRQDTADVLLAVAADLLPDLTPYRFGRMAASPLSFFRGAAAVMAADLATTPHNGVFVQACGDADLHGFGVYPARTRTLVCDMTDFDETQPAPWEWDVKRLAASFVVAARDRGLGDGPAHDAAAAVVRHYRGTIAALSTETSLGIWAGHLRVDDLLAALGDQSSGKHTRSTRREAGDEAATPPTSPYRLVRDVDGRPTIARRPPYVTSLEETETTRLRRLYDDYRRTLSVDGRHLLTNYHPTDIARLALKLESAGKETAVILLTGRGDADYLFLQVRRVRPSVLAPYAGDDGHAGDAERIVDGQRLTQALVDPFLGRPRSDDSWYVRSLRDPAVALEPRPRVDWFASAARVCGATLARAHARSVDPAVISGYLGGSDKFDEAIAAFAAAYADQNERDFELFRAAVGDGRIDAES